MADSYQAVLEAVALPRMVVHVARGHHPGARFLGDIDEPFVPLGVAVDQVVLELDIVVIRPEPVEVTPYKSSGGVRPRLLFLRKTGGSL